ncbi:hypothetical protein [Nocardioides humi]|uniref:Uncharacterized protein n=1 Tax=Nocardioides humi TaxID=449461 RepID=A0ABN2B5C0_9ACTN|nr:hypothetical protein [Nocardioides humi]
MTDLDTLDSLAGPALRERLRDERPDLEHLAAASLAAGRRLRRRRRLGTAAGTTAGVAVVAAVSVAAGALAGSGTTAHDSAVATTPTPTVTATVTAAPEDAEGLLPGASDDPSLPVVLDAPGWDCEYFVVDEKAWCSQGELGVSVVVRPRSDYDAWQGSADKAGSALWTSPVHGNYFVTLQGGEDGLSPADLDAFVAGITFAPRWERP